eukprot:CAMPEP_0197031454 /NCGR_PEP_ID=MMETSP1384-20130603/10456_1 /TAXON_ID=29189 /ORGANISM="Ammonia sp." /LENGTH=472 /DNA_ID=CAMNT_0042460985 /DNA_START=78 /DNA_END=1496 /DNA_ORIENTATION=+
MYGTGTPVTDESDDDDDMHGISNTNQTPAGGYQAGDTANQHNLPDTSNYSSYSTTTDNAGGGGGFTETILDDDNNEHNAEAWDEDHHQAGASNTNLAHHQTSNNYGVDATESENWLNIDYEGQPFHVPLTHEIRTFGDIKQYLLTQQQQFNIELSSTHYIVDPDTDQEYQDDDDALIANHKSLVIKWRCFSITIVDGLDFRGMMNVAEDFTIAKIKEQVESDHNLRLDQLSKDGNELQNDKTLREYDIVEDGHTLISRICVQIDDPECGISLDILVCEFWSIKDVMDAYLQSSRRERHEKATLALNDRQLDLQSTVYYEKIENQFVLKYSVGKYKVLLYDEEMNQQAAYLHGHGMNAADQACQEIEVMDNQTITEIQQEYARITRKPFMKNDKLLSNERQLEENVPLYKLRIKDNEPLFIEREQQMKPTQYICAECGAIVSLRPYDTVQCRECFMNIVYKKRTTRVCQYNCR